MKKSHLAIMIVGMVMQISHSNAQTDERKLSLGVHTGVVDSYNDVYLKWFNFNKAYRGHVGISAMYNLNPWLNVGVFGNYGRIGTLHKESGHFKASMLHANAQLRLRINNGSWMSEDSKLQPYVYIGTGLSNYTKEDETDLFKKGTDWTGNLGAGVTYMITDLIGVNYNLNYAVTNHDNRDFKSQGHNEQFMQHSLGVVFNLNVNKKKKESGSKDSDGDGVADKKDKCDNTPKNVKVDSQGCPVDSDNDGTPDYQDECPNLKGVAENHGCPALDKETKVALNKGLQNVEFETGSDVIRKDSYNSLDGIAAVMKSHGDYRLSIEGHTDDVGEEDFNMQLSKDRAEAVKKYLMDNGVEGNRLMTKGYGESKPVVPNDSEENRAKNRRVEFKVKF